MCRFKTTAMTMLNSSKRLVVSACLLVSVSGCSVFGVDAPWGDDEPKPDYDLIAANLVNSLAQFPHLNPLMATVQMAQPSSEFRKHIKQELNDQGYKIETIASEEGINQVRPEIKSLDADGSKQDVYVLNIGRVSAERAYAVVAGKTVPVSEQIIRGVEERKVTLNDDIFEAPDSAFTSVTFKPYAGPQIEDVLAAQTPQTKARNFFKRKKRTAVKVNLYETLVSNYADEFSGYEDIDQSILIFPNDSLRLGNDNKSIIEQYVENMNPETDLLSVIGCSHGNTEINNGNSLLALGRANRVKEALMFSGLEHDQILEEGCWAPQTFDEVMPRRGVVLTLKRKKNS